MWKWQVEGKTSPNLPYWQCSMPQLFITLNPQGSFLQTHTDPREFSLLNTVVYHWQNSALSTVTRIPEPGLTSWTWSPPFNLHFHILEKKKTSKVVKSGRKSHPLLEFVVSKASAKLLVQLWCTSLPWELPGHQFINHTWVLDTVHLPPLKQNNADTEFLLSTHLQAGCSKPAWFPWGLRVVWNKNSIFKTCSSKTTPQPQTMNLYSEVMSTAHPDFWGRLNQN